METNIDTLLERLNKLEKQNKIFKIAGCGIISLLLVFIIHSIIPISQIKAQRFIICDNQGKECGWFGIEKNLPKLVFEHEFSKTTIEDQRLMFQRGEYGPFLVVTIDGISSYNNDKKGTSQSFILTLSDDGSPYLSLDGKDCKVRLDCKEPSLSFTGKEPQITMNGDKYGVSLYTKEVPETNEPLGLIMTKWQQGTKKAEIYWHAPIQKISK